ncbi:MAG: tetratricopeptide repeat protein [Deltaproteobacteria bacterium]|nr:tetratricopeptide repeat protein [Deltaproteobacteria bacterium]
MKILTFLSLFLPWTVIATDNCPKADSALYGECMIENISTLISEKKYTYALDLLRSYEEWFRAQKQLDYNNVGKIVSGKAFIYYLKGDYNESLKSFNEALEIFYTKKDEEKVAETKTNISIVKASMSDYKEAIKVINDAEKYYRKTNRVIDLADVLFNKGIFYYFSNDYEDALHHLSEAEKIYLAKNLKIRYLSTQVLKGIIKAKRGDYRDALYLCENNLLSFSLKYYCIALAYDGLQNREEARKAFRKALEKIDKNINQVIKNSGDEAAQALSEKYSEIFTEYLLFMLRSSIR